MTMVAGIGLAILIIGIVTWMLLIRALREKYAVLWLTIGLAILVLGLFPGLLSGLSGVLGVALPSNLIFGLAILLLVGVCLHLSWELSRAEDEVRRLAEDAAIERAEREALERRVHALEEAADRGQDSA